jgi:murein DD-endopeptidase MepM/ murein hydrolase activator NlpD
MNRRYEDITNGSIVSEYLSTHGIPDVWGTHLVDAGKFSRGWGMRTTSEGVRRPHGGVDICGAQGVIIRAMRSGLVEHSGQGNGYGECILIRHADGSSSWYAHLNDRAVEAGMLVQGNSPIATMGRTSNIGQKPNQRAVQGSGRDPRCTRFANMGIHLHFSTHGHSRRKLPHMRTITQTVNTDKEWNFGTDPQQLLGARGIRLVANQIATCPGWTAGWR